MQNMLMVKDGKWDWYFVASSLKLDVAKHKVYHQWG